MKESPYDKLLEYYNNGTKLEFEGKYEEAISYYDKAIEIDSAFYGNYAAKATSLYHLGKYDEALICIDKALKAGIQQIKYSNPPFDNPITLAQKSFILGKLERFDEAFSCINKALETNPDCMDVQQAKKNFVKEFEKVKRRKGDVFINKENSSKKLRCH